MLTEHYQNMLKEAVKVPRTDYNKTNAALAAVIEGIKTACPDKFHTADSLRYRVFWDEPKGLSSGMYDYYVNRASR